MTEIKDLPTRAVDYELKISIDASVSRVWQALCEQTNDWWLPDFHVAGPGSTITFDPSPGGHLVERTDDGGGVLWFTVHACNPGRSMTLIGALSADYGGPATTMLTLTLEERPGGSLLKVRDALVGHVSDKLVESLKSGWVMLLGEGLKRHAEKAES